jgi:predicted enzyme related to lactoylglutathione lyase
MDDQYETQATMPERDGYPAGVPCWVDTAQPDPEAAVRFYSGLFGWDFVDRMPAEAPGRYYVAQLRGKDVAAVGSLSEGMPLEPAWTSYVWVDSADDAAARAEAAGGKVLLGPLDAGDAGRMALLADTEGATFAVWQAGRNRGAQLVNEPGTWNFSELNTRDLEAARAFYGTLFGWEADTVDMGGDGGFTMWRRPGYGDHLEERFPGTRERMQGVGAPPGFEDAVAWLVPMGDEQDGPPHWSITLAVADADAAAAKAAELGGDVLVPPMDAPWVRMTVIRDPQGATFTASQFVPPES